MSKASDKAYEEWARDRLLTRRGSKQDVDAIARAAFEAGWQARKAAQYRAIVNPAQDARDREVIDPAYYGQWIAPRDNPNDKRFKTSEPE